jgi:two-component system, chemotaxis family, sensor kinase CheA
MDNAKYVELFISEARDYLDTLNDLCLVLESNPKDEKNIGKLFRAFHTLKSNAATMGYKKFSELAHSLEDILSLIRDEKIQVSNVVINLIFKGCDILEEGLKKIIDEDSESIKISDISQEIQELLETNTEKIKIKIEEKVNLSNSDYEQIEKYKKEKYNIYRIILVLEKENVLKVAKSLIVLREIEKISKIIKTTPKIAAIQKGEFGGEVEYIIAIKDKKEKIENIISKVTGIKQSEVIGLSDAFRKSKKIINDEKEIEKTKITDEHQEIYVRKINSIKVNMNKLDQLMDLVGELLINNIQIQEIYKIQDFNSLKNVISSLDKLTLNLQEEVMQIRMLPIGNIFNRFPRMIRDLAKKEGKKVNLEVEGEDIEFDRSVLDEIGEPLVHLLRNCVDHGIEKPDTRINNNKKEIGTIKLIAKREKSNALIIVKDDGIGIDPEKVKASSIKKGIINSEDVKDLSKENLQKLIFKPGVSTTNIVTEISGRGVGMDVVLNKINELGGNLKLDSSVGLGTTVTMELPLTLAIISALLVKVDKYRYALPLSSVNQTLDLDIRDIKTIQGQEVFILRNKEIPLFWLGKLFNHSLCENKEKVTVAIVNREKNQIGLIVDSIISQQQVLVKNLSNLIKGTKGMSGATILGDGSVAMILDINSLQL